MKSTNLKRSLDALQLSDVYALMFFILYKITDLPEYATLSEICYLLDGNNITRLITYFAGKTIKIPTAEELISLINALLLYQKVNLDGWDLTTARNSIKDITNSQREQITDLYIKILPIMSQYNIDRSQLYKNER